MDILQVLCLLQLLVVPASTTPPPRDRWGEFGPYGSCSRTCGTGVATRTRKCITLRTDGGHNCVGSSKSYRTCNTHECPVGSRDFREEQCSQFDRMDFQGRRHTWIPYYGASNPCELTCAPRGENFFYRHRPSVVDGTQCYVGRNEICVDGICRVLVHGEFLGLDDASNPVQSPAVSGQPRETPTYIYKSGVYGDCSVTCNGGMQYRSVECWIQDPVNPRVVEETHCITQHLQRPQSQKACNMQPCNTEYRVSSYSVCSVTCGEGQRTREVHCVSPGGERLADHACRDVPRPPSVQTCRRPACQTHIAWHVTDYGLCTRSCGGGVRERRVGCFDVNLNPFPEARCGTASRPITVESCNTQLCPGAQMVPSVQDPRTHESTMRGFVPFVPGTPTTSRPNTNVAYDPYPEVIRPYCAQSLYGCCPDGHTSATGPMSAGCLQHECGRTTYGCCSDGVTPAQGYGRYGCPEHQSTVPSSQTPANTPFPSSVCSLPRDEGPCDTWKVRFHFDSGTGKCTEFWFGGCQGNANNFVSMAECQRVCGGVSSGARPASRRGTPARASTRSPQRVAA